MSISILFLISPFIILAQITWQFDLFIIVEAFWVVFCLSDTTQQLPGFTCCQWTLQHVWTGGIPAFSTLQSCPPLCSAPKLLCFRCAYATVFPAWIFSVTTNFFFLLCHHHHHHHVMPLARISLTLSRHFSLSFIASGRSSGLHSVSSHSCWMYVYASRPAFAQPYVGVHNELVPTSPAMSCMSRSSNLDRFRDRRQVAI